MKKIKWKVIILLLLFLYVSSGQMFLHFKTKWYLDSQGYNRSEIKSIDVKHSFLNIILSYDEWIIRVIFEDEPDATYYYTYKNWVIHPSGVSGTTPSNFYMHTEGESSPSK